MNGGPSGFHNAPVTRTFVMASALLTGIFGLRGRSLSLRLPYQDILKNLRLWRIIISQFAFSSTPELMFGLYLVYYFRLFERQIGSNKYSMFILFSSIASSIFEVLALAILKDSMLSVLASGPYSLIFASFVPFYFDIPVSSRFRIFGLHFSDKSFVYLAGFQLLLSSWKRTLVPGICGVLVGFLYRFNACGVRRIKFPGFVTSFFAWLSWSSASSSQSSLSSRRSRNGTRRLPSYGGRGVERIYPSASQEPPESSVDMLVSMGFDSSSSRQALVQARNDINVATNILLEAQAR